MHKLANKAIVILITINFIYLMSGVIHFPLRSIDVYSIWMLKAKVFYLNSGVDWEFLKNTNYSHPQYPILLPFIFYQIFRIAGEFREIYVLMFYPFIYLLVLFIAYTTLLRLKIRETSALILVYIYSMFSPLLAQGGRNHAGSADIIITVINWLIVYIAFQIKAKKNLIYLLAVLIAISSQIKMEGLFYSAIILFLPVDTKKKFNSMVIAFLPTIIWLLTRNYYEIGADFSYQISNLSRFIPETLTVIVGVVKEMLNYKNWYIFWVVFWLLVFVQKTTQLYLKKVVIPALVLISAVFVLTYIVTDINTYNQVSSSADRLMMQMTPFIYLVFSHKLVSFLKSRNMLFYER